MQEKDADPPIFRSGIPTADNLIPEPVPAKGLEPILPRGKRILSPPRLPFRHAGSQTAEKS